VQIASLLANNESLTRLELGGDDVVKLLFT